MSLKSRDISAATGTLGSAAWILERSEARLGTDVHRVASLVVPIHRLSEHLRGAVEAAVKPFDLLPAEFEILQSLLLADPDRGLSPSELYQALLMSSGGVAKLIRLLAGKALICTQPDPHDGRGKRIMLTSEGRSVAEQAVGAVVGAEAALIQRMLDSRTLEKVTPLLVAAITRLEDGQADRP